MILCLPQEYHPLHVVRKNQSVQEGDLDKDRSLCKLLIINNIVIIIIIIKWELYFHSKSSSGTLELEDVVPEPPASTSGSTRPELVVEELDTETPQTRSEKGGLVKCAHAEENVTDRASFSAETGSNEAPLSRLAGSKSVTSTAPLPRQSAGDSISTPPTPVQSDTGANIAMPLKPVQSHAESTTVTPPRPRNAGTSSNPLSECSAPVTMMHTPAPSEVRETEVPVTGKSTPSPLSNPERTPSSLPP